MGLATPSDVRFLLMRRGRASMPSPEPRRHLLNGETRSSLLRCHNVLCVRDESSDTFETPNNNGSA
eukprot:5433626-Heterocapsa_arctica.AAC.1